MKGHGAAALRAVPTPLSAQGAAASMQGGEGGSRGTQFNALLGMLHACLIPRLCWSQSERIFPAAWLLQVEPSWPMRW